MIIKSDRKWAESCCALLCSIVEFFTFLSYGVVDFRFRRSYWYGASKHRWYTWRNIFKNYMQQELVEVLTFGRWSLR